MTERCLFCGSQATLLCDTHIGWERLRKEMPASLRDARSEDVPIRWRKIHTCDAPLCEGCAVRAGCMFVNMRPRHVLMTTDYCPGHDCGTLQEITALQAEAWRVRWRTKVAPPPGPQQADLF